LKAAGCCVAFRWWARNSGALLLAFACMAQASRADSPSQPGLTAADLAVVINLSDPLSAATGSYYVDARHIPPANVLRVRFDPQRDDLPVEQFATIQKTLDERIGQHAQGIALTWARPYRVGCMSITSAFAFGFDTRYQGRPVCPSWAATGSCPARLRIT